MQKFPRNERLQIRLSSLHKKMLNKLVDDFKKEGMQVSQADILLTALEEYALKLGVTFEDLED